MTAQQQDLIHQYQNDINRMKRVINQIGHDFTTQELDNAWSLYSDDYAAGWLILPKDDNTLLEILTRYLKRLEYL